MLYSLDAINFINVSYRSIECDVELKKKRNTSSMLNDRLTNVS